MHSLNHLPSFGYTKRMRLNERSMLHFPDAAGRKQEVAGDALAVQVSVRFRGVFHDFVFVTGP